jgi:hypothetical protein
MANANVVLRIVFIGMLRFLWLGGREISESLEKGPFMEFAAGARGLQLRHYFSVRSALGRLQ